jgi:hypothetical protein
VFIERKRAAPRLAVPATALALLTAALLLWAPKANAACPTEYCTDATGSYTLSVEPLSGPIFGPYADCVWQVHVDFGDGTSAEYVFEGEKGLSGSHKFPSYGKYEVNFTISAGYHKNSPSHESCPSLGKTAYVTFQDPAEVAEEEAKAKEEAKAREEAEKAPSGETPGEKSSGGPGAEGSTGSGGGAGEGGFSGKREVHLWNRCPTGVYVHQVACGKARRVIAGAKEKLVKRRRSARVAGFSCKLDPGRPRPISCRRGMSRILGPPG